ncbi:Uncharacterized protein M6B38_215535 [Iris pallida]|uniref:Secreted protein n=1 Tax=Iris pallida TaxID=29817 RepID=A0AAX6E1K3_IRIPA|nr:Uncharacterized protein M6B38_215535 [Iris pallida]
MIVPVIIISIVQPLISIFRTHLYQRRPVQAAPLSTHPTPHHPRSQPPSITTITQPSEPHKSRIHVSVSTIEIIVSEPVRPYH